jgi:anti-sigma-K factor RskA
MSARPDPEHERWADSAAAYVLGALPDDECRGFEAHLATCEACRDEVRELGVAAAALPASALPLTPPPALKQRVMADVEREAALLAAAGPQADRPPRRAAPRRRFGLAVPRAAALAGAAALAAGVLIGVVVDRAVDGGERTVRAEVDRSQAPRASAALEIRDGRATLVVRRMPAPPRGRVYQVWVKRPGRPPAPTSALFSPSRTGAATTAVPGSIEGVEQVLVTHEPLGGSRAPTRKPVLAAATAS